MAELREEALRLLEKARGDSSLPRWDNNDSKWSKKVMHMGTLADKIALLTLAVKQDPQSGLSSLDSLLSMLKKKSRRESFMALDAISALYKEQLLPSDRKLLRLESRPVKELADLVKKDREKLLMEWYIEDQIKSRYASFLDHIEVLLKDQVETTRMKVLGVIYDLLSERSEKEEKLLTMLVNKLGDPDKKIATKASRFLVRLLGQHPNMKTVIVEEVERLLYRPNINTKAQYYAVCFLIQIKLSDTDSGLAVSLIKIYFSLFKAVTTKKAAGPKMMGALLTGVNRTYPFTKGPQNLIEHIDTFFRYVHTVSSQIGIQVLMLLYQVLEREGAISDRFYLTLYRKMMDPDLLAHPRRSSSLLNLLYKSMKRDDQVYRVKAFIKRLLQLSMTHSPPFICGALIVISETIKARPKNFLNQLLTTVEPKPHISEKSGTATVPEYSSAFRNPAFCGAEYEDMWELQVLRRHYHPSVSRFADCIIQRKEIDYAGDPFEDFTSMHFLDRFVYRNPKNKGADSDVHGAKNMNVLNSRYIALPEKQIPDDEKFIHRYLNERLKKTKAATGHDDIDVESVSDGEFDQFLDEHEHMDDDMDLDFAGDINDEEERKSLNDDVSLLGGEYSDDDFSTGEKDALDQAFESNDEEDEDEDDDNMGEDESDYEDEDL